MSNSVLWREIMNNMSVKLSNHYIGGQVNTKQFELDEAISRKISQAIKQQRLAKNLTLEAIAKGICSLSYLSKIENMSIVAHTSYLEAICERLDINFEELVKQHKQKDLKELLKWYLYDYEDKINSLESILDNPYYCANDGLVKIIFYLYKNNFPAVEKEIDLINDVKSTLTAEELNIFTLLVTEYYIKTNQFRKIESNISLLMNLAKNVSPFQALYYEQLFIVAYHLNIRHLLEYCLNILKEERFINYPFWRLYKLQMMMLEIQSREKHNQSLIDLHNLTLDQSLNTFQDGIIYYQALIYLNNKLFKQAYELLQSKEKLNAAEFTLLILCGYLSRQADYQELIAKAKSYTFSKYDSIHKKFLNYLIAKMEGLSRFQLSQLLKYHLLPANDQSPIPLYSRIYLVELLNLGLKNSYQRLLKKNYSHINICFYLE